MMRACNSGLICGSPFMTRLTLLTDTPAWAATSRIVARAGWRNDIAGLPWTLPLGRKSAKS
jgi:hypothetical protein